MKPAVRLNLAVWCMMIPYLVFLGYVGYQDARPAAIPVPSWLWLAAVGYMAAVCIAIEPIGRRLSNDPAKTCGLPRLVPSLGPANANIFRTTIEDVLRDAADALNSSRDLHSVLQTIMQKMAAHYHPDTWSLLLVDEEMNELYFALADGNAAESLKNIRLKVGEGIVGWVAKQGEPLIVPEVMNDPRFTKRTPAMTNWETRSFICVPVHSKSRVLGIIQLVNPKVNSFEEDEMLGLRTLCDYVATAIENAHSG